MAHFILVIFQVLKIFSYGKNNQQAYDSKAGR
jgi:hypothetical protein